VANLVREVSFLGQEVWFQGFVVGKINNPEFG
jgi:hypothetical protein